MKNIKFVLIFILLLNSFCSNNVINDIDDWDKSKPSINVYTPQVDDVFGNNSIEVRGYAESDNGVDRIEMSIDDGPYYIISENATFNYYYNNTSLLTEGFHVVNIKAIDQSGNISIVNLDIEIDRTVPHVALTNLPCLYGGMTNSKTINIILDNPDNSLSEYEYRIDKDGETGQWITGNNINESIAESFSQSGEYTLYVIGGNSLGIWQSRSSATTFQWTIIDQPSGSFKIGETSFTTSRFVTLHNNVTGNIAQMSYSNDNVILNVASLHLV